MCHIHQQYLSYLADSLYKAANPPVYFPSVFLGNNPLNCQNFVLYGSNYVPIYKKQIYGIELCPTGSDNTVVIIGVVIAASVASAIIISIITLLCVRRNRRQKKKYQSRQDSHNEYTEQPSAVRLFIV